MKVLIACECSGRVRDAFRARGHDAISCDVRPTERAGPHITGDVRPLLRESWDLVIAHPPCTYLSRAGKAWWNRPGRAEEREKAMAFFMECYNANAPCVAVENPVGYPFSAFRPADQTIQPFFFGSSEFKTTCLWLRGLRPLEHRMTDELFGPQTHVARPAPTSIDKTPRKKRRYWTDTQRGSHARSRTHQVFADAMAAQWGTLDFAALSRGKDGTHE